MDITSIFRFSGNIKADRSEREIGNLNTLLRDKLGAGLGFILAGVLVYAAITLLTIYNLLVSL